MSYQRFIIEMGMGNDLHGGDYMKAAKRAIEDALHGSTLAILKNVPNAKEQLKVKLTVGVQEPDQIDAEALKAALPVGEVTVDVKKGGLNSGEAVVAQAAIEAFLPFKG